MHRVRESINTRIGLVAILVYALEMLLDSSAKTIKLEEKKMDFRDYTKKCVAGKTIVMFKRGKINIYYCVGKLFACIPPCRGQESTPATVTTGRVKRKNRTTNRFRKRGRKNQNNRGLR